MKTISAIIALALVTGCAANTGAQYIPIVDLRSGQNNYQSDLQTCQTYATQRQDAASGAAAGAFAGALLGLALSAALGGNRGQGAAFGAISGGSSGAVRAEGTQRDIITRCLSNRGYSVLN